VFNRSPYRDKLVGVFVRFRAPLRNYFREGLEDKLGVDMHLFKVGSSSPPPSPYAGCRLKESKQASLFWMATCGNGCCTVGLQIDPAMLAARIVLPEQVTAANGDMAQHADQTGRWLEDTRARVEALLTERGVADDNAVGGYRQVRWMAT
jgi:protease-4